MAEESRPVATAPIDAKPPQLATPDNTYGTGRVWSEHLGWSPDRAAGDGPCPKCGAPAPNLHPAVQHEGEVSLCLDPFHGLLPNVAAGGAIPTGFVAQATTPAAAEPKTDPMRFEQYKLALAVQRHIDRFRSALGKDAQMLGKWASLLVGSAARLRDTTKDDRVPVDEANALCLAAAVEAGEVDSARLSLRTLGGFSALLRLLWAQRSLVTLLGELESAIRNSDLGPVKTLVARLRAEAVALQDGHVSHEVSELVAKLPDAQPESVPVVLTAKSPDIALAEHLRRTVPSAPLTPFHSWHAGAVAIRKALGLAEKPDAPDALQKRLAEDVAHRATYAADASRAEALELWALLDDIDTARDMFRGDYEGFAKYADERIRRRFAILSEAQHAHGLALVPVTEDERVQRAVDAVTRQHIRMCLRRRDDWAQPSKGDPAEYRSARSREADTCATLIATTLGGKAVSDYPPTGASQARRDKLLLALLAVCSPPRAEQLVEEILVLFDS